MLIARYLLGIALFALFFFLLKRLIASFLRGSSTKGREGVNLVEDPFCHTYLPREKAIEMRIKGVTYYFCSRNCAEAFEKKAAGVA